MSKPAASAPRPAWLELHAKAEKWLQRYATMPNKRGEAYVLVRDPPAREGAAAPAQLRQEIERVYAAGPRDGFVQAMLWQTFLQVRATLAARDAALQDLEARMLKDKDIFIRRSRDVENQYITAQRIADAQAELLHYWAGQVARLRASLAPPEE